MVTTNNLSLGTGGQEDSVDCRYAVQRVKTRFSPSSFASVPSAKGSKAWAGHSFVPKLAFSEPRQNSPPPAIRQLQRPPRRPRPRYFHTTTARIPHPSRLMYEAGPMRRKSVDIGGLALALAGGHGCGSGWGGWDEDDISEAMYGFSSSTSLRGGPMTLDTLALDMQSS